MTTYLLPDVMGDVRTYLRTLNLAGKVGNRVFFRWPDTLTAWPSIRLHRIDISPQPGATPLYDARLGIDIYGKPAAQAAGDGTYSDVCLVDRHLQQVLFELEEHTIGSTHVGGVQVTGSSDAPDPDDGAPRLLLTTIWTVRATSAAA